MKRVQANREQQLMEEKRCHLLRFSVSELVAEYKGVIERIMERTKDWDANVTAAMDGARGQEAAIAAVRDLRERGHHVPLAIRRLAAALLQVALGLTHQELMRVRAEEVRAEQALRETAALEMEIERKDELIATRGALVPHEKSKAIWA